MAPEKPGTEALVCLRQLLLLLLLLLEVCWRRKMGGKQETAGVGKLQ